MIRCNNVVVLLVVLGLCIITLVQQTNIVYSGRELLNSDAQGNNNGRAVNLVQTNVVEQMSGDGSNVNPVKDLRKFISTDETSTATARLTGSTGSKPQSSNALIEKMGGLAKTYETYPLFREGQGAQSSSLKFDHSTSCGLQQEVFMEKSLTRWFKDSVPLISSVVGILSDDVSTSSDSTSDSTAAMGGGGAKTRTYHIQILTPHLKETHWFEPDTWFCNNNKDNNTKYPAILLTGGRHLPDHPGPNPIRIVHCTLPANETLEFLRSTTVSSRGVQPTYDLRLFASCDEVRASEEQVILQQQLHEKNNQTINNNTNNHVMHACTQTMGNFSRLALAEWIEYHHLVGFDHIWVYINEPWSTDHLPQRSYVTYIPNNYKLVPNHWPFFEKKVRIDFFFQTMQQNECLYRAKRMKIGWMALHDPDEFIVLDDREEPKKQADKLSSWLTSPAPTATSVKQFLAPIVSNPVWNDKYGAVQLNSIPFGRNPRKEAMNISLENRLLMDWTWRSNKTFTEYPQARYKLIVRPINVHFVNFDYYINSGKRPMLMPANVLRLHHYKKADRSVFGTSKNADLLQDSWFRQRYRDNITQALSGERTYLHIGYQQITRSGNAALAAFGPVQAWAERDDADVDEAAATAGTGNQHRKLPNRTIYTNVADIPYIPFDNTTLNPVLPSMKVNSATMLNVEIPLDFSISADMTSTIPWSNVSTLAFYQGRFYSGFRNQIMVFTVVVMEAARQNHGQLLLRSVRMKDTFGTNKLMDFAKLWDVAHWNSHYPRLPRLVDYDPILHSQFDYQTSLWHRTTSAVLDSVVNGTATTTDGNKKWFGAHGLFATQSPKRPHAFGKQHLLSTAYMRYALKGRGPYAVKTATLQVDPSDTNNNVVAVGFRNPVEILMLQGAMRPHPNFQTIIDRLLAQSGLKKGSGNEYMTLHARVEPDMQKHPVCRDKKVLNLTDIFDFIEQKWPNEPPVSHIFMPINRQYMEQEGYVNKNDPKMTNWIAVHNLNALNHARDYGLWRGRVKVLEFGAAQLDNTTYADRPSTGGAMLNFFLGIGAKIFIGTEVSSYSHDLLATRFYRNAAAESSDRLENYKYLPDGLHDWTPPGTVDPPGFSC
jgi:Glycosyltransferase family 92